MIKKYETSVDYRHLADKLWDMARIEAQLGHSDLADKLKEMSDSMHNVARKKEGEEEVFKGMN